VDWTAIGAAATGAMLAVAEYFRRKRQKLSERPRPMPRNVRTSSSSSCPPPITSDAPTPPRGTRFK
jgi:hypothetical protein